MQSPDPEELTQSLKSLAVEAKFFLCGAAPAIRPPHYDFFCQWLDGGLAGTMEYLPKRREAYAHPRSVLDHARSVLMLGASYYTGDVDMPTGSYRDTVPSGANSPTAGETAPLGSGRIARYAWAIDDYHDWIHSRLKGLMAQAQLRWPSVKIRGVVDTAPLLERDFARLAGLGWVGKNTMLINKRAGSYFFLAALILDAELHYDLPHESDHCGSCTRCLTACPTQAFPEPGVLDARRCISYLTIEHRGPVPLELRTGLGSWWFGCDVCQDVCPWNRHAHPQNSAVEATRMQSVVDLVEMTELDEAEFRARFRKTPMWRTKRVGAIRNAAYVLGNQKDLATIPALERLLHKESEPTIRGAAAWALGQLGGQQAMGALEKQQYVEIDPEVIDEIQRALASLAKR
ncbi:MAG: tRNA epoxyqueuosine(34) reductase QueG [Pirellulaceae bacterium]|nr:tRNA epoxyqueuosine(34) reductase QueG [Pirellulaceae bacterium]